MADAPLTLESVNFVDKLSGLDLFADAVQLQKKIGKDRHGAAVAARLDSIEESIRKGVVYYDARKNILSGRDEILAVLYRDHKIYRPQAGAIRGKHV